MGLSGGEIFLVILVALMLFGAKGIPDIARGLAKGMKEFKKAADEIKEELNKSTDGSISEISNIRNDLEKSITDSIPQINNPIEEVKQDINKNLNS
jgi:sec-independent protein translocase protein TatA